MKMRRGLAALPYLVLIILLWTGCGHTVTNMVPDQGVDTVAAEEAPGEGVTAVESDAASEGGPAGRKEAEDAAVEAAGEPGSTVEERATPEISSGGENTAGTETPVETVDQGTGVAGPAGESPGAVTVETGEAATGEKAGEEPLQAEGVLSREDIRQRVEDVAKKITEGGAEPEGPPGYTAMPAGSSSAVTLNFDNADITNVINTMGTILGLNYLIDSAVKGTVSIHTRGRISREDLMDIFMSVLKASGAAIVKDNELYHIVPTKDVKTRLLIPRTGTDKPQQPPRDRVVLQVVRLDYISATEVAAILKPFLTPDADITPFEKNNIVLITDFEKNLEKLLGIIDLIDVNVFEDVGLKIYLISEADVKELAQDMQKIFSALEIQTKSGRGAGVNFIPIPRINSLLVVSSVPKVFDEVEKWLAELDKNISREEERTFIYHVKNGVAGELADILNLVFTPRKREETPVVQPVSFAAEGAAERTPAEIKAPAQASSESRDIIIGDVKVIPYATTNTIIIKASPRDYQVVKRALEELDIIPRQVLIEIIIAEITLTDDTLLGIEYTYRGSEVEDGVRKGIIGTSFDLSQAGTLASGGFTASIVRDSFLGTINALASQNRINILASPHIIAADGKKASIDIGDEVPLVASKIFVDNREELTIERRDTGVILKVTPHINTTGLVTLDVSLELSDAAKAVVKGESDIRIFERNADTTMVVQDNQTIVIGGLIDEKEEKEVTKIPFLGDIPLLGYLFKTTKDVVKKTELVLLITPKVIHNIEEANSATAEFMKKLEGLRDSLERMQSQNRKGAQDERR